MKNNSFLFPFPMLGDKFFDKNKDGKLSATETIFRDAHHIEMEKKWDKANKK